MPRKTLLKRFLIWRLKTISQRQFIMLLSILVGVGSGLIAVFIKNTAHSLGDYLRDASSSSTWENYNLLILPLIGIVASVLWIKYIVRKPESNGFSTILYAIAKRSGI